MRTIKEWQRDAHALAVEKGWHSRECTEPFNDMGGCSLCGGTGRVPVDPHSPTRIAACLERIHAEISEAGECNARGRMELGWIDGFGWHIAGAALAPHWDLAVKPEGFPIELADVFLRLCDLAESQGVRDLHYTQDYPNTDISSDPEHIASELTHLHRRVSNVPHNGYVRDALQGVLTQLGFICAITGVDLLAMAELKHTYNKTRPLRHGGKVL